MSSGFAHFLQRAGGMLCQLHFAKALTPTLCDDGFFSPAFLYTKAWEKKKKYIAGEKSAYGCKIAIPAHKRENDRNAAVFS